MTPFTTNNKRARNETHVLYVVCLGFQFSLLNPAIKCNLELEIKEFKKK